MKKLLVILLVMIAQRSYSQCAVYWGDNKVAGIAWRADYDPPYTMDELKRMANDECKKRGGTNCKLLTSSYDGGWWGIIIGETSGGKMVYECLKHQTSEAEVKQKIFAEFRKDGGIKESEALYRAWKVKGD